MCSYYDYCICLSMNGIDFLLYLLSMYGGYELLIWQTRGGLHC